MEVTLCDLLNVPPCIRVNRATDLARDELLPELDIRYSHFVGTCHCRSLSEVDGNIRVIYPNMVKKNAVHVRESRVSLESFAMLLFINIFWTASRMSPH